MNIYNELDKMIETIVDEIVNKVDKNAFADEFKALRSCIIRGHDLKVIKETLERIASRLPDFYDRDYIDERIALHKILRSTVDGIGLQIRNVLDLIEDIDK